MKSNQNNDDKSQNIINRNNKDFPSGNFENLKYLYPNGHRITHQMRWFKGSRNRGFKSDIVA